MNKIVFPDIFWNMLSTRSIPAIQLLDLIYVGMKPIVNKIFKSGKMIYCHNRLHKEWNNEYFDYNEQNLNTLPSECVFMIEGSGWFVNLSDLNKLERLIYGR